MWYMHEGFSGWMIFGWAGMVIFWGAIIALAVWGIRKVTRKDNSSDRPTPLDIARERYAKGEISRKEFEQLKKDL